MSKPITPARYLAASIATVFALAGCGRQAAPAAGGDATTATQQVNAQFAKDLKLDASQDFEDAKRGLIARPSGKIMGADGNVLVDFDAFKFVDGPAPLTVNPSLWRHAILNAQIGLFKVTDGIWQLRGFDIANMTVIEGKSGTCTTSSISGPSNGGGAKPPAT